MYVCMYVCMYVYIYIYIYIHTYIKTHISLYISLSLSIYIYIYTHTHARLCHHLGRREKKHREFRDVVVEDVGFEIDSLSTLKNWRCGDFTPEAAMGEGLKTSILKPHILKHHIPELPKSARGRSPRPLRAGRVGFSGVDARTCHVAGTNKNTWDT